jgi:hypothetical protein
MDSDPGGPTTCGSQHCLGMGPVNVAEGGTDGGLSLLVDGAARLVLIQLAGKGGAARLVLQLAGRLLKVGDAARLVFIQLSVTA